MKGSVLKTKDNDDALYCVSPDDFVITREGIEGYDWPIAHQDLIDFGQGLEMALAQFFQNYPDQDKILPYKIASKNYVTTIATCFQAELLAHRLRERGQVLCAPDDWDVWPNVFCGKPPSFPAYLKPLQMTQKPQPIIQRLFQPMRLFRALKKIRFQRGGALKIDGLFLTTLPKDRLDDVIVATQRLSLISKHAFAVDSDVYLYASERWFEKITDEDFERALEQHDRFIDRQFIEIIKTAYQTFGLSLSDYNEAYLLDVLTHYTTLIQLHTDHLRKTENLPCVLWTGTGGHIWDVILRCEVKRRGGKVVAHDHGGGVPHLDHPEKGWVEMWSCDEFMTYSKPQAETFKRFMHGWPNLDKDLPDITYPDRGDVTPAFKINERFSGDQTQIKKIRIFSTIYSSEEGRGLPIYPYVPYIDWQVRLISQLQSLGYEVSFKPHPDSRLKPLASYQSVLGVDVIEKNLEDMGDDFDLYIFDLSNTSVLQTALMTNKPVLIVDFGVMQWREDAFDLFTKRCGYVRGFYEGSRMCVDWDVLKTQVEQAALRNNNHEFASTFYF